MWSDFLKLFFVNCEYCIWCEHKQANEGANTTQQMICFILAFREKNKNKKDTKKWKHFYNPKLKLWAAYIKKENNKIKSQK